jgi:hypothetical protein
MTFRFFFGGLLAVLRDLFTQGEQRGSSSCCSVSAFTGRLVLFRSERRGSAFPFRARI